MQFFGLPSFVLNWAKTLLLHFHLYENYIHISVISSHNESLTEIQLWNESTQR